MSAAVALTMPASHTRSGRQHGAQGRSSGRPGSSVPRCVGGGGTPTVAPPGHENEELLHQSLHKAEIVVFI